MSEKKIGILGAGKLGSTLARLGIESGYDVEIASHHAPEDLQWILDAVAPGAKAVTADALVSANDLIVLAIPLSNYKELDPQAFAGKTVLDATNYWFEVDGTENHISDLLHSSSEVIQDYLKDSYVAKAFNHMGYHDVEIEVDRHPEKRRAMAFATDHDAIRPRVEAVLSDFGFDPYDLGALRFGLLLEPGSPLFGEAIPREEFDAALSKIYSSSFGKKVVAARKGKIS